MSYLYTYILAPDVDNNGAILHAFAQQYTDLVQERRMGASFRKDENDIISDDGSILVPTGAKYFLMKVTTSEFDPETMLEGVTAPQLFNRDNLPFDSFWLNVL